MTFSFYWHDYETWGADPGRDRPAQFAGVRTDADLQTTGKPLVVYCKPSPDMLPHPEACLITGITPRQADAKGVNEAEFFRVIHDELSAPGTCGVGYNSIRFDDEFTRFGLYRNFYDPYAREWQTGNSRWDIIDMVRLTHALRPEGIDWPVRDDGAPSFRLEQLTAANGISHEGAHDALADVYATIELAKLIRDRQPRLFDYLLKMRGKRQVGKLLDPAAKKPVLHVSSMYRAERGCMAMVVPLARHPVNANGVIVYDLGGDPDPLIELHEDEIARRLFTPRGDLQKDIKPVPLKTVHLNKCPVVVPLNTLTDQAAERWGIDVEQGALHLQRIQGARGVVSKINRVFSSREFIPDKDPDQSLYSGGFFSDADRQLMNQVRLTEPRNLAGLDLSSDDARLPEMLFRYRARNYPGTLSAADKARWQAFCHYRLTNPAADAGISLDQYRRRLAKMTVNGNMTARDRAILSELADWPEVIGL
ncbi:MAG: exodeoxyribonuclease I [Gammaproteobacteria bacterium]|nr:exodeoxyribonuclease I [Gammaproteobacteria bacterium]